MNKCLVKVESKVAAGESLKLVVHSKCRVSFVGYARSEQETEIVRLEDEGEFLLEINVPEWAPASYSGRLGCIWYMLVVESHMGKEYREIKVYHLQTVPTSQVTQENKISVLGLPVGRIEATILSKNPKTTDRETMVWVTVNNHSRRRCKSCRIRLIRLEKTIESLDEELVVEKMIPNSIHAYEKGRVIIVLMRHEFLKPSTECDSLKVWYIIQFTCNGAKIECPLTVSE